MTQDEIIGMLQESTIEKSTAFDGQFWTLSTKELEAFAKLVAAKEREECCEAIDEIDDGEAPEYRACQEAIRARGEPPSRGEA